MADSYEWFVGIDWGTETHTVCVIDPTGQVRDERSVAHTIDAVNAWMSRLLEMAATTPDAVAIAIETPRGLLVETLLERGFAVFAINPKQVDRFRDRFTTAGAKDDRRDAHVLGDALRTDRTAFRRVRIDDPLIQELRELTRADGEWQVDLHRVTNRLREQVARMAPGVLTLCPAADEPWFWTLVETAATPAARQRVTRTEIRALLKRHHIRRYTADQVWDQLHRQDFVPTAGVVAGVQLRVTALIEHVRLTYGHRKRCAREIERVLSLLRTSTDAEPREHRDVEILESLPGVGRLITATMLTEAARPLTDRDYHTLRAQSGIAPVTKRSGKGRVIVLMRYACNQRLRQAAYHWGRVSITCDTAARAFYDRQRQRGHSHGRALRAVVDRWLRILVAMLNDRTLYDRQRFTALPEPVVC